MKAVQPAVGQTGIQTEPLPDSPLPKFPCSPHARRDTFAGLCSSNRYGEFRGGIRFTRTVVAKLRSAIEDPDGLTDSSTRKLPSQSVTSATKTLAKSEG